MSRGADAGLWSARCRGEPAGYTGDAVRDLLDHQIIHRDRLDWAKPVRDYMPEFRLSDAIATATLSACRRRWSPR